VTANHSERRPQKNPEVTPDRSFSYVLDVHPDHVVEKIPGQVFRSRNWTVIGWDLAGFPVLRIEVKRDLYVIHFRSVKSLVQNPVNLAGYRGLDHCSSGTVKGREDQSDGRTIPVPARDIGDANGSSQCDSNFSYRMLGSSANQCLAMDQHKKEGLASTIRSLSFQSKQSTKKFFGVEAL